jgi:hypothetical protein
MAAGGTVFNPGNLIQRSECREIGAIPVLRGRPLAERVPPAGLEPEIPRRCERRAAYPPQVNRESPSAADSARRLLQYQAAFGIALPVGADGGQSLGCGCSSGVEHNLAKVGVEGSNPFARSRDFFSSSFFKKRIISAA